MFARLSSISPLLIGRNYLSQRYVSLPFVNRWRDESTQKNNIGITHKLSMSPMVDENNPTEDNKDIPIVRHYCFLVHGWMGNDSEMSFIETSMQEEIRKRSTNINSTPPQRIEFMIHKTVCNNGNTSDGIANGGTRLAKEIQEVISSHDVPDSNVEIINTISFIGNSLGGLYARYAIGVIHSEDSDRKWHFNVFCTTATPHLGCSSHTYVNIPRSVERLISTVMLQTGKDLFRNHPINENDNVDTALDQGVIRLLGLDSKYLVPLSLFHKRIAFANAFMTDFQVPTDTAAFLCEESNFPHRFSVNNINENKDKTFLVASFETEKHYAILDSIRNNNNINSMFGLNSEKKTDYLQMSNALDALGWKKVFLDVRHLIPFPKVSVPSLVGSFSGPFSEKDRKGTFEAAVYEKSQHSKASQLDEESGDIIFESKDLLPLFCPLSSDSVPLVPLGHTVMIANSKSTLYKILNKRGSIVVNHIVEDVVDNILSWNTFT